MSDESRVLRSEQPFRTHADVVNIKLNGLGLLLVFEMVISQQVVDLVNDWGRRSTSFREARRLKRARVVKRGRRAFKE